MFGARIVAARVAGVLIAAALPGQMPIDVMVVDQKGRPVEGVPLGIGEGDSMPELARTSDSGRARLEVPQRLAARPVRVRALIPATPPVEQAFDPTRPDSISRPIRLQLPPCGSVRVYARDAAGDLTDALTAGALTLVSPELDVTTRRFEADIVDGDSVTFRFVGLGLEVDTELTVKDSEDVYRVRGKGPSFPHELVILTCEAVAPSPELTFRVLDLDGSTLSNAVVHAILAVEGYYVVHRLQTDAGGRCSLRVEKRFRDSTLYVVRRGDDGARPTRYLGGVRRARLRLEKVERLDLGDCQLAPEPVLVAGRVVDPDGRPLAGVAVRCRDVFYAEPIRGHVAAGGDRIAPHFVETDAGGRFALREVGPDPLSLRLEVSKPGYALPTRGLTCEGRQKDLRIVMQPAAVIAGRFAPLPDGVEAWRGSIRLWPAGRDYARGDQLRSGVIAGRDFEVADVIPGRYRLGFFVVAADRPQHAIDVEVTADREVRADGLDHVDWRAFSDLVRISLRTRDGSMVSGVRATQDWDSVVGRVVGRLKAEPDGTFVAFVPRRGAKLKFTHEHYRPIELEPPFGDRALTMVPKLRVRLRFGNLPSYDVLRCRAAISKAGRSRAAFRRTDPVVDADGTVDLTVDQPGGYVVELSLWVRTGDAVRRSRSVASIPVTVEPGAAKTELGVVLTVDELEAVAAAAERLHERIR